MISAVAKCGAAGTSGVLCDSTKLSVDEIKSTMFSSWATCLMRKCVDKTEASNDLRLETESAGVFVLVPEMIT